MGGGMVVVVVMVGWGVLLNMAELGVMGVHLGLGLCLHPGCVVQVGGVGGMGDESGVLGLRGRARRLPPLGAEDGSQQRGGVGEGLLTAGGAVPAGGGSPPHVGTANDGAFHIAV